MTFALQGLYQRHRARRIERLLRRFSDVMEASVSESMDRLTVTLTGQKTNATSLTAWLEDHGVIGSLVERVGTAPRSPEALLGPLALRTLVFLLPGLMVGAVHDFWPDLNLQIRDVLLNVQALLATGLIFVGAGPVVMAAFRRPADGGLAGSTLPILGGLVVFAVSLFAFLDGREPQFSAAMLAVGGIVLLDVQRRWLRRRSQRQLVRLRELAESEAYVLHSEGLFCLPATDLKVGDLCLVHPGGVVPSDGVVVAGQAAGYDALDVDTRHHYGAGDTLRAGVRVLEGALTIRVLRESPKSSLAYLIKVLAQPWSNDPWLVRRRARAVWLASGISLLVSVAIALFVFGSGLTEGGMSTALAAGLAALLATSPLAAEYLSTLPLLRAVARGVEHGVLFRDPRSVRELAALKELHFDKTGTLTVGVPELRGWVLAEDCSRAKALGLILGLSGYQSRHPISSQLQEMARDGLEDANTAPGISHLEVVPGRGVVGQLDDGTELRLGNRDLLGAGGVCLNAGVCEPQGPFSVGSPAVDSVNATHTVVYLSLGDRVLARFHFYDPPREGARVQVQELIHAGLEVGLMSGDGMEVTRALAQAMGITLHCGGMGDDERKHYLRKRAHRCGGKVGVVADGWNDRGLQDASSLSVLFGVGAGFDLSDDRVILLRPDLALLTESVATAQAARRRARVGGIGWAVYSVITWGFAWLLAADVDLTWFVLASVLSTGTVGHWCMRTPFSTRGRVNPKPLGNAPRAQPTEPPAA